MTTEAMSGRMPMAELATLIEDLYYGDFKQRDAFIGQEHISPIIGMAYAQILNDEYRTNKLLMKSMVGYSFVELSLDWLLQETVPVKKDDKGRITAELSKPLFFFDFDSMGSAVQSVRSNSSDDCGGELIRISANDRWKFKRMPITREIFYFPATTKGLEFLTQGCVPDKVEVSYIPNFFPIDDEYGVPITRAKQIAVETLQLLLGIKNGQIIDKTNNSNPNAVQPTEIDADSLRNK